MATHPNPEAVDVINGPIDPEHFLATYWQKKPVLIRQAFPGFESPLSPEELAGLACEEDVPARLLIEHGPQDWTLKQGPFTEQDFINLPERGYSLLVTDCEKIIPDFMDLVDAFRFIPDWRIDDLMISYAPPGGSVGAHIDQYDVFLLQAHGQRRWMIENPAVHEDYVPDIDVRILQNFTPNEQWVLAPGDVLYLPPGIPHHGIAEDDCMTYSVGFRAPTQADLVSGVCDRLSLRAGDDFYHDPDLTRPDNPALLSHTERAKLREWVRSALLEDDFTLDQLIAETLSERPIDHASFYPGYEADEIEAVVNNLAQIETLRRTPASRWILLESEHGLVLCIDGQSHPVAAQATELVELLTRHTRYTGAKLAELNQNEPTRSLLVELFNHGLMMIEEDSIDA